MENVVSILVLLDDAVARRKLRELEQLGRQGINYRVAVNTAQVDQLSSSLDALRVEARDGVSLDVEVNADSITAATKQIDAAASQDVVLGLDIDDASLAAIASDVDEALADSTVALTLSDQSLDAVSERLGEALAEVPLGVQAQPESLDQLLGEVSATLAELPVGVAVEQTDLEALRAATAEQVESIPVGLVSTGQADAIAQDVTDRLSMIPVGLDAQSAGLEASSAAAFSKGFDRAIEGAALDSLEQATSQALSEGIEDAFGSQAPAFSDFDPSGLGDSLGDSFRDAVEGLAGGGILGKILGSSIGSIQQGIGQGLGVQYAQGIISVLEGANIDLQELGARGAKRTGQVVGFVGDRVSQGLGIEEGLAGVPAEIEKVRQLFDEIIDEKEISRKISVLELQLGGLVDSLLQAQDVDRVKDNLKGVASAAQDIAIGAPAQGLQKRRDRIQREVALPEVLRRAQEIDTSNLNIPSDAQSVVFGIGGFAGAQGKSGEAVSQRLQLLTGEKNPVIPISNPNTEVSRSFGENQIAFFADALQKVTKLNLAQAYNPDAIEAAAQALAVQEKTGLPTSFAGYSAGGFVAEEASSLVNLAGKQAKAVGIGTPRIANAANATKDFDVVLGRKDPLSKVNQQGEKVFEQGGTAHKLAEYLGSVDTQVAILEQLGISIDQSPELRSPTTFDIPSLSEDISGLLDDVSGVLGDQGQVDLFRKTGAFDAAFLKQIEGYRGKIREQIGDAVGATQEFLEEADQLLAETERTVRATFGAGGETAAPVVGLTQPQRANFAILAQETAQASGFDSANLPSLRIDDRRLDQIGADTFVDLEKNQILIRAATAELLSASVEDIDQQQQALVDLVKKLRGSFRSTTGPAARDLPSPQSISQSAREQFVAPGEFPDPFSPASDAVLPTLEPSTFNPVSPQQALRSVPIDRKQVERYNVAVLKELSRTLGGSGKGSRAQLIEQVLAADVADFRKAIAAIEPLIETGPKGGQALNLPSSTGPIPGLERSRQAEKRLRDTLLVFQSVEAERREQIARIAIAEIDRTQRQLEEIGRKSLDPQVRRAAGATRGRLEGLRQNFQGVPVAPDVAEVSPLQEAIAQEQGNVEAAAQKLDIQSLVSSVPDFSLDAERVVQDIIATVAGIPGAALAAAAEEASANIPNPEEVAARVRQVVGDRRDDFLQDVDLVEPEASSIDTAKVSRQARQTIRSGRFNSERAIAIQSRDTAVNLSREEIALRRNVDRLLKLAGSGKFSRQDFGAAGNLLGDGQALLPGDKGAAIASGGASTKQQLELRRTMAELVERAQSQGAQPADIAQIIQELQSGVSVDGKVPDAQLPTEEITITETNAEAAIQEIVRLTLKAAGQTLEKLPDVVGIDGGEARIEGDQFLVPNNLLGRLRSGGEGKSGIKKEEVEGLAGVVDRDILQTRSQAKARATNNQRLASRGLNAEAVVTQILEEVVAAAGLQLSELPEIARTEALRASYSDGVLSVPTSIASRLEQGDIQPADVESLTRAAGIQPRVEIRPEVLAQGKGGLGALKQIPQIKAADVERATISADGATIQIPRATIERIESGNLQIQDVQDIARATRQVSRKDDLLNLSPTEVDRFGPDVEGQVAPIGDRRKRQKTRAKEADAIAFASRVAPDVRESILRKEAVAQFEDTVGLGGNRAKLAVDASRSEAFDKVSQAAQRYAVDLSAEVAGTQQALSQASDRITTAIAEARNIEILPADEILQLQSDILAQVEAIQSTFDAGLADFDRTAAAKPEKVRQELADELKTFDPRRDLNPLAERFGVATVDEKGKRRKRGDVVADLVGQTDLRELEPAFRETSQARQARRQRRVDAARDVVTAPVKAERAIANTTQDAIAAVRSATDKLSDGFLQLRDAVDIEPVNKVATVLGTLALSAQDAYVKLAQAEKKFAGQFGAVGNTALFLKDNVVAPALLTGGAKALPAVGGAIGAGLGAIDGVIGGAVGAGLDAAGFGAVEAFTPAVFAPAEASGGLLSGITTSFHNAAGALTNATDNLAGQIATLAKNEVTDAVTSVVREGAEQGAKVITADAEVGIARAALTGSPSGQRALPPSGDRNLVTTTVTAKEAQTQIKEISKQIAKDVANLKKRVSEAKAEGRGTREEIAALRRLNDQIRRFESLIKSVEVDLADSLPGAAKRSIAGVRGSLGGRRRAVNEQIERAEIIDTKSAKSAGGSTVDGITQGIRERSAAPEDAIVLIAEETITAFKNALGIASPAKAMIGPGQDVVRGVVVGIELEMAQARQTLDNAFDELTRQTQQPRSIAAPFEIEATSSSRPFEPGLPTKQSAIAPTQFSQDFSPAFRGVDAKTALVSATKRVGQAREPVRQIPVRGAGAGQGEKSPNLELEADVSVKGAADAFSVFGGLGDSAKAVFERFQELKDSAIEANPILGNLFDVVKGGIAAFVGFELIQQATQFLGDFTRASLDAALSLSRLETALDFSTGTAVGGAAALKFVRDETDRLNIPLASAQDGFKGLAAATRNTALEGSVTEDVFSGLSAATAVLGLDQETAGRAFVATEQIISKGKLSAEELRQQLAEAIPGSFQVGARALGVSEAELNRRLELGQVSSQEFIPAFARQLQSEFGTSAEDASKSAQGAVNKFDNSVLKAQEGFGKLLQPAQVELLNTAADAIGFVSDNIKALGIFAAAAGAQIFDKLLSPLGGIVGAAGKATGALKTLAVTGLQELTATDKTTTLGDIAQGIQSRVVGAGTGGASRVAGAKGAIASTISAAPAQLASARDAFLGSIQAAPAAVSSAVASIPGAIGGAPAAVSSAAKSFGASVGAAAQTVAGINFAPAIAGAQRATQAVFGFGKAALQSVAPIAAIFAAFEVARSLGEIFGLSDLAKGFRDFAIEAERSLQRVKAAGKDASKDLPTAEPPRTAGGFDLTLGLGGIFGFENGIRTDSVLRFAGDQLGKVPGAKSAGNAIGSGFTKITGGRQLSTVAGLAFTRELENANLADAAGQDTLVTTIEDKGKIRSELQSVLAIDKQIQSLGDKRAVLQSQPTQDRAALGEIDRELREAQERRQEASEGVNSRRAGASQQLRAAESQLQAIEKKRESGSISGSEADQLTAKFEGIRDRAQKTVDLFAELELSVGSVADPVGRLLLAFEKINLELARSRQLSEEAFNADRLGAVSTLAQNFGTDRNAQQDSAVAEAAARRDRASRDLAAAKAAVQKQQQEVNRPEVATALEAVTTPSGQKITTNSNLADLELAASGLSESTQPKQKQILEQVIEFRKSKQGVSAAEIEDQEAVVGLQQAVEARRLKIIQDASAKRQAQIEQAVAQEQGTINKALKNRDITEGQAQSQLADVAVAATKEKIAAAQAELAEIKNADQQKQLSAETFAQKELELTNTIEQARSELVQNELQREEARRASILETLDLANRRASSEIEISQTTRTIAVQEGIVSGDTSEAAAAFDLADVAQEANLKRLADAKRRLDIEKKLEADGTRSKREAQEQQISLQQEIANINRDLISGEIDLQNSLRAAILDTLAVRKQESALAKQQQQTETLGEFVSGDIQEGTRNLRDNSTDRESLQLSAANAREALTQIQSDPTLTDEQSQRAQLDLLSEIDAAEAGLLQNQLDRQQILRDNIDRTLSVRQAELNLIAEQNALERSQGTLTVRSSGVPFDRESFGLAQQSVELGQQRSRGSENVDGIKAAIAALDELGLKDEATQRRRIELQGQLANAQKDAIETEISLLDNLEQRRNLAIDRQVANQRRANDAYIRGIDAQVSKAQAFLQLLDQQSSLLAAQQQLTAAINASGAATLQIKDEGLQRRAADASKAGDTKQVEKIEKERLRLAIAIADQKIKAEQQTIALAKQQLEIELTRERIAGRIALQESRIAQLRAQGGLNQAKGDLTKAKNTGDTEAIQVASEQVAIAIQEVSLTAQQTALNKENLLTIEKTASIRRKTLDIQSDTSLRLLGSQRDTASANAKREGVGGGSAGVSSDGVSRNYGISSRSSKDGSIRSVTRDTPEQGVPAAAAVPSAIAGLEAKFAQITGESLPQFAEQLTLVTTQSSSLLGASEALTAQFAASSEALENQFGALGAAIGATIATMRALASTPKRFAGGPVRAGMTFSIAERGPEILDYGLGDRRIYRTPQLVTAERAGVVISAGSTSLIMRHDPNADRIVERFTGGPVAPGDRVAIAERGPELLHTGGNSILFEQPSLIRMAQAGRVEPAAQTIATLNHKMRELTSISPVPTPHVETRTIAAGGNSRAENPAVQQMHQTRQTQLLKNLSDRLTQALLEAREVHVHGAANSNPVDLYAKFAHDNLRRYI